MPVIAPVTVSCPPLAPFNPPLMPAPASPAEPMTTLPAQTAFPPAIPCSAPYWVYPTAWPLVLGRMSTFRYVTVDPNPLM